ncbi:hypothetical protein OH687_32810 [Burkholderia anthina]|nr:hypothetical protein OH687_32810 [Burkholderia anthina]
MRSVSRGDESWGAAVRRRRGADARFMQAGGVRRASSRVEKTPGPH